MAITVPLFTAYLASSVVYPFIIVRDFEQKPRETLVIRCAIELPAASGGEIEALLRASHPHVTESALFLHLRRVVLSAIAWKHVFFETHKENDGKFQPFRGMKCQKVDDVPVEIVSIRVGEKSGLRQGLSKVSIGDDRP
jgi:hypothetical protein